jgi:hypothetical protein
MTAPWLRRLVAGLCSSTAVGIVDVQQLVSFLRANVGTTLNENRLIASDVNADTCEH